MVNTLLVTRGDSIFVALSSTGVFRSTDRGATWTAVNIGLPPPEQLDISQFLASGDNLYLLSGTELLVSPDQGGQWTQANLLLRPPESFGFGSSLLGAGAGVIGYAPFKLGVYLSRDEGKTFLPASLGLADPGVFSMAFADTNLFVTTADGIFIRPLQ